MFRFWQWWSTRVTSLQAHFATRRKGVVFTKWRSLWSEAELMYDSEMLADMHYHNYHMRKSFIIWEDQYLRNKLDLQLLNGALAWGRRKLVKRTWKAWSDASKGVYDGVNNGS
jgi:hypothetical protein